MRTGRNPPLAFPKPLPFLRFAFLGLVDKMIFPRSLLFAAGLAVLKTSLASPASLGDTNNRIVDLGYARYLGNHTPTWSSTVSYLGLPYAEPPLGDRRYRAPFPLNTQRVTEEANGKVVDARAYPDFCIQGAISPGEHIFQPSLFGLN